MTDKIPPDEPQAWSRDEIVSRARDYLKHGGRAARREISLTSLDLDRLLQQEP